MAAADIGILLKKMAEIGASDLHIRSNSPAYARWDGNLKPIDETVYTAEDVEKMAQAAMTPRAAKIFAETNDADFARQGGKLGRFRFNVYKRMGTPGMAIRRIPAEIPPVEKLGLPMKAVEYLSRQERGIVLVTGITGSGKSTTLAGMIDYINRNFDKHIVTIEDPIEFVHQDKMSIMTQREIGNDTDSFNNALRSAMRQDPDVILVGEMRDLETISLAITAAQTGHLVFGTLHTVDAAQTVSRIVDVFPANQQDKVRQDLAETLQGVISQRLIKGKEGGRFAAVEALVATGMVRKGIAESELSKIGEAIAKGDYYGMQNFNQALVKLYKEGKCELEEVKAAASNPDDLMLMIRGISKG